MKLIDSHAHVNFRAYHDDYQKVIARAAEQGVCMVNVGTQYTTSKRAVEIANEFPDTCWAAVGTHPVHLKKGSFEYADTEELDKTEIPTIGEEVDFAKYRRLASDPKVVAIGEIGLDYHHFDESDDVEAIKKKQREILIGFIDLANEIGKPVMIHCWDAYPDLLEILTAHPATKKGVIHSFVGGYKTARKFIELGYVIGLNGIITYSDNFDRLIREIELENILLETDCPFLTPVPKKGERNEPTSVLEVAKKIAEIKEIPLEKITEKTMGNTIKLFDL